MAKDAAVEKKTWMSKSLFMMGKQCPKALWLRRNRPELMEQDEGLAAVFQNGHDVGALAQELFPGGVMVPGEGMSIPDQIEMTQQEMSAGTKVIYEAAFHHDGIFFKADILVKKGRYWHMYEVKAGTRPKGQFIQDIALQYYVAKGANVELSKAHLVHINTSYVREKRKIDPHGLFTIVDVTPTIKELQPQIEKDIKRLKKILGGKEPDIDIGPQCDNPYACWFQDHCWDHVPEKSIFEIADVGKPNVWQLYKEGILLMKDVPREHLGWRQQLQVDYLRKLKPFVNKEAVREFLTRIEYPLSFLDFETAGYASPVPIFIGTSPYQQTPFQFSLHVMEKEGGPLRHKEFLHDGNSAPHEDFVEALLDLLPKKGSIIAWNKKFEIGVLREQAARFPKKRETIEAVIERFVDLMEPYKKKDVYHGKFNGSYSIKAVLPALVPELSYKDLEIGDGGTASAQWMMMRGIEDLEGREAIRKNLLKYCCLDTLAMVRILEWMEKAVAD